MSGSDGPLWVSDGGDRVAIARGSVVQMYELPGGRLLRTIDHSAAVSAVAFALTGWDAMKVLAVSRSRVRRAPARAARAARRR